MNTLRPNIWRDVTGGYSSDFYGDNELWNIENFSGDKISSTTYANLSLEEEKNLFEALEDLNAGRFKQVNSGAEALSYLNQ